MLTGKQRAYLKGLAMDLQPAVYIGKAGITDTVIKEIDDYLTAHELVKVKVQEGAETQPKEAANVTAAKLNAEYVQSMGRRFVLYRASKERRITLPR